MLQVPDYPKRSSQKSLHEVNIDVHSQLYSVIETLKDEHLKFKIDTYDRTIGSILSHTLSTQEHFFIGFLALGNKTEADYKEPTVTTIKEAVKLIQDNLNSTTKLISGISAEELKKEIKTEWGQVMSKELAIWQGITQITLHTGEICVMAGIGGFYKGTLG